MCGGAASFLTVMDARVFISMCELILVLNASAFLFAHDSLLYSLIKSVLRSIVL